MALEGVVQSFKTSSRNYSELSSNVTPTRPLLGRTLLAEDDATKPVEEMVTTPTGNVMVARQGRPGPHRSVLLSYPDLGLNYVTNFQTFLNSAVMAPVTDSFCIYHVNPPGQEPSAEELPDQDYNYPSMEELSEQVEYIVHHYGIKSFVGFGVGLGANVLARLAHRRPTMVEGLVLINCNSRTAGWLEWVYHKVNMKNLNKASNKLPESVVDFLVWYHFGRIDTDARSLDTKSLVSIYKQHFSTEVNPRNLSLLMHSYMTRTDLRISREVSTNGKPMFGSTRSLRCPVLNATGDHSPHVDATVTFNGRLQPNKCTWMKFQEAGMVIEEQPGKLAEAIKLFLQGLGYILRTTNAQTKGQVQQRPPHQRQSEQETTTVQDLVVQTRDEVVL